jgi:hypothetical protein
MHLANKLIQGDLDRLQGELDRLQGLDVNQDRIGRLADIAVEKGLRFNHGFDGAMSVDISHRSNELVDSHIDSERGEQFYVGFASAQRYTAQRGLNPGGLITHLGRLKAWLPEEDVVALPSGERLGVKVEALPRLIETMQHPPYAVKGKSRFLLSKDACRDIAAFYKVVLGVGEER